MASKKKLIKIWVKSLISLINIFLIAVIVYLGSRFYAQTQETKNIQLMSDQLIDAILPLSSLLSKSAGNIYYHKDDHAIHIQPSLFYKKKNKIYKLDLTLSKPIYSLIDCTGNLSEDTVYPLKIRFIWQPMPKFKDRYELICERHNNFKNLNKSKNIQRKVLLQHINKVKFKFLESMSANNTEGFKYVDAKDLQHGHNQKIAALQIGMLVQSNHKSYRQKNYKNYHVFQQKVNFIDRFSRKVIYMTVPAEIS